MKLNIAQNLRKYRKERGLTQETLAASLGVSSQSISKWECGDGYPDIELLPDIANFFGITIDVLVGNDPRSVQEDLRTFYQNVWKKNREEKLPYIHGYHMKYPGNACIANLLTKTVLYEYRDRLDGYRTLLCEACRRVVDTCTEQELREEAIRYMCLICPEEDFKQWYGMCCGYYSEFRGEILQERLCIQKKYDECLQREAVNRFYLICHLLGNRNKICAGNFGTKENMATFRMKIIEILAEDGVIPEAWRGGYASACLTAAHRRFLDGDIEEGYKTLERAVSLYENIAEIDRNASPDLSLDLGNLHVFGPIRLIRRRGALGIRLGDGTEEFFHPIEAVMDANYVFRHEKRDLYHSLIRPHGWEGFDKVRGEERFNACVARAKALAGIE